VTGSRRRPSAAVPLLASALLAASLLAACGAGATAPPASASPSPSAAPSVVPSPADVGAVIRASWTQALPPRALFGNLPVAVVTSDGRALAQGAVTAIYPGPLVAPVTERPISPAGVAALLQLAKDLGLLRVDGDFTGGALPPGAAAGRLQIVADGVAYDLIGNPAAAAPCAAVPGQPCPSPAPGTPAAFADFWNRLLDLPSWLGPELGPEQPSAPASYAIIVGPPPEAWAGATPLVWPVAEPALDTFGRPVRGELGTRCGIATGELADALRPLFAQATELTPFVATETASATHGLTVRPLLPGDEDPCAPIVE
jgi:hypothetical protein